VFGDKQTGRHLLKFGWTNIRRHTLVKGTASPDDPSLRAYWEDRQRRRSSTLTRSYQKVARRQGHICDQCGESLYNGEELHLHHEQWRKHGGKTTYDNLTFRHLYCHQQIHRNNS
jgi:RNA-directed DNA polymerase